MEAFFVVIRIGLECIAAFFATAAFCVLFNAPKKQWGFGGLTGAVGWGFYRGFALGAGIVAGTFLSALMIMLMARVLSVIRRAPVTVFLVSGIIPIVPGVGIYYTSYYLIMNELSMASAKGMETLKLSVAICLGIMCVLLIPQKVFWKLGRWWNIASVQCKS